MTGGKDERGAQKARQVNRPVRLRFIGAGTIALKGPVTGKPYLASESAREIEVDPRDADEFVQSGVFVRA